MVRCAYDGCCFCVQRAKKNGKWTSTMSPGLTTQSKYREMMHGGEGGAESVLSQDMDV